MNYLWLVMIVFHAVAGLTSFVSGVLLLSRKQTTRTRALPVFLGALIALIIFMIAAVISHWDMLSVATRATYGGLVLLAGYMIYRAWKVRYKLRSSDIDLSYVDDVGFSLIALFDGFIIVSLIDLRTPVWVVIAGAVAAVIIGIRAVEHRKRTLQTK